MSNEDHRLTDRAKWEDQHHTDFDYRQKNKLCLECGEADGRHTYTCIYYDRDAE